MTPADPILGDLNKEQRKAVTSDPNCCTLVLAGVGSGKTRVLAHRFAWLVETQNVQPKEILAATFTNKAATEMRERIGRLRRQPASGLWVGTFHFLARRMLLRFHDEAGLPGNFQILDREDQKTLIRQILRDLDRPRKARDVAKAARWISLKKTKGLRARYIEPESSQEQIYLQVMEQCERRCDQSGSVDFDELLLRCVELLRDHSSVQQYYQRRFLHLLVDEFQDTDDVQSAWLELLAGGKRPLFVVGDDDQSIYVWRGSSPRHILDFQKKHKNTQVCSLEQNYRSTAPMLKATSALISNNYDRLKKRLWTDRPEQDPITVFGAPTGGAEADYVVGKIEQWVEDGGRWEECAVLYRMHRQSQPFETNLSNRQIPYRVYGGPRFFERREVKDTLAYLRLCLNPNDDVAWQRVCNVPPRGIGARTIEAVRAAASATNNSLHAVARERVESEPDSRASRALGRFETCLEALREETEGCGLAETIRHILEQSGLLAMYREDDQELEEDRSENLGELVNSAAVFEDIWEKPNEDGGPGLIEAFLDSTALEAGERGEGVSGNAVQLMTLHVAKGLEFPLVFIVGLEDGTLPMMREDSQLEDERRLCYVGMTRAQQQLVLTHAYERLIFGRTSSGLIPSRFLQELPDEHTVTEVP
ncbi:MAG: UvrD-helicase domain-containing protein, partial [Gammaproteobacteria bacterium]|nr:UvrD-helicase domain-containing protein [Gammaproteobacteria bacterium]